MPLDLSSTLSPLASQPVPRTVQLLSPGLVQVLSRPSCSSSSTWFALGTHHLLSSWVLPIPGLCHRPLSTTRPLLHPALLWAGWLCSSAGERRKLVHRIQESGGVGREGKHPTAPRLPGQGPTQHLHFICYLSSPSQNTSCSLTVY